MDVCILCCAVTHCVGEDINLLFSHWLYEPHHFFRMFSLISALASYVTL